MNYDQSIDVGVGLCTDPFLLSCRLQFLPLPHQAFHRNHIPIRFPVKSCMLCFGFGPVQSPAHTLTAIVRRCSSLITVVRIITYTLSNSTYTINDPIQH